MKNYKKNEPATPLKSWTLCHVQSQQLPGNTHHMMWKRESVARGTQIMVKFCLQTLCFVTCPSCCAVPHFVDAPLQQFLQCFERARDPKLSCHDFQKINPSTCNLWLYFTIMTTKMSVTVPSSKLSLGQRNWHSFGLKAENGSHPEGRKHIFPEWISSIIGQSQSRSSLFRSQISCLNPNLCW